jgi:para-nitrobenzyl esterase
MTHDMRPRHVFTRFATALAIGATVVTIVAGSGAAQTPAVGGKPIVVDVSNFVRAESDLYFGRYVARGAFGKFLHERTMTPIDKQEIVRMNRDTLYSFSIFDLEAAPVTVTLPDPGKRFMSMQVISEDHYTLDVVYAPVRYALTKDKIGTRYVFVGVRTLANPADVADLKAAHGLQDAIGVEQARTGSFEVPTWEKASQNKVRAALEALNALGGTGTKFGKKSEVDPVGYLTGAAVGWGGNPEYAAIYVGVYPKANDGKTIHTLSVKDVPVDGFWSVSVYNAKGFFEKNALEAYSVNNLTAQPNADGSYTVQFGGCRKNTINCLPITPDWNYTVRLYRARKTLLDGTWSFPEAQPIK